MIELLKRGDVVGLWVIHLLSFLVATLIRRTKLLKAYNSTQDSTTIFAQIAKVIACALVIFLLADQLILQLILKLYFLGAYTDWVIYTYVFIALDILLIGLWPGAKIGKNLRTEFFFQFARIYRIARGIYVLWITAQLLLAVFLASLHFPGFTGFVIGDYRRGNETETFEGLYFELKTYGEGFDRVDLVIYKQTGRVFKKKIYSIRDIGNNNATADIESIYCNRMGSDTILFSDLVPNILIKKGNEYILTNKDDRLNIHRVFFVNGKAVDTTIRIQLK